MDKKSQKKSGRIDLPGGKFMIKKPGIYYSDSEQKSIIEELIDSGCTKAEIWLKYTGTEHTGGLTRWMRKHGYDTSLQTRRPNFNGKKQNKVPKDRELNVERMHLQKQINALEAELKLAKGKTKAYSRLTDTAEEQFNIPIRKKSNTKS